MSEVTENIDEAKIKRAATAGFVAHRQHEGADAETAKKASIAYSKQWDVRTGRFEKMATAIVEAVKGVRERQQSASS
jgi:hypothetical protein